MQAEAVDNYHLFHNASGERLRKARGTLARKRRAADLAEHCDAQQQGGVDVLDIMPQQEGVTNTAIAVQESVDAAKATWFLDAQVRRARTTADAVDLRRWHEGRAHAASDSLSAALPFPAGDLAAGLQGPMRKPPPPPSEHSLLMPSPP